MVLLQVTAAGLAMCACFYYGVRKYLQGPVFRTDKRLDGRVAVVTGANSGIGLETTRELCRRGARVVMLCRSEERGLRAMERIRSELVGVKGAGDLALRRLDLSSLSSVRRCAAELLRRESRLDLLVLNAGVMMCPPKPRTEDGFDMQMGTNHLGHFLLTSLLRPLLTTTSKQEGGDGSADVRVVVVSSVGHQYAKKPIRLDDLNWFRESEFLTGEAYFQSKLANVLFAKELDRRMRGTGVKACSLHPGVVATDLSRHAAQSSNVVAYLFYLFLYNLGGGLIKTPYHGVQTTLFCCLADGVVGGGYYADCARATESEFARREEDAKALWALSERLVGCGGDSTAD